MSLRTFLSFTFILLFLSKIQAQEVGHFCTSEVTDGTIVDFEHFNDSIYATGFFTTACNNLANRIARWDGNEWLPSRLELTDPGHRLTEIDGDLFIARYEESIDSNWVLKFDGTTADKLGEGIFLTTASGFSNLPNLYDVIEHEGNIVACGEFDRVGQKEISGIMQWNGAQWDSLGSGLSDHIDNTAPVMYPHQLLSYDGDLYVAGNFKYAGDVEVNGIARWDGSSWSALGPGFNNTVYAVGIHQGSLIAGGAFTQSGADTLHRIAKWNGTTWESLGFGFTSSEPGDFIFVHTFEYATERLFIAGGLKEVTYSNGQVDSCGGVVSLYGGALNVHNGGVKQVDIEAIAELNPKSVLIGGGVFGNGYTGQIEFPVGVEDQISTQETIIFPNPASGSVTIQPRLVFEKYAIRDMLGRVVQKDEFQTELKLDLPEGLYLLELQRSDFTYSTKLILE